jgi:phosphocarrier protein
MIQRTVTVINKLGLHARPSAMLVTATARFKSDVYITKEGLKVNGKSIMGVMMLAAEQGSQLLVEVNGSDEEAAMAAIVQVVESGFGGEI